MVATTFLVQVEESLFHEFDSEAPRRRVDELMVQRKCSVEQAQQQLVDEFRGDTRLLPALHDALPFPLDVSRIVQE